MMKRFTRGGKKGQEKCSPAGFDSQQGVQTIPMVTCYDYQNYYVMAGIQSRF